MSGRNNRRPREDDPVDSEVQEDAISRRQRSREEVARRRAAHFARYRDDDPDQVVSNVHTGGNNANTLGPWSSAEELLRERDAQLAEREAKLKKNASLSNGSISNSSNSSSMHPSSSILDPSNIFSSWQPWRLSSPKSPLNNIFGSGTNIATVSSLENLCLNVLADYVDCIETLEGVPGTLRAKLARTVTKRYGSLSESVATLLTQVDPDVVHLPNCTALDSHATVKILKACGCSPVLNELALGFCGRGLGPKEAAALAGPNGGPLPYLTVLEITCAYRLNDTGLEKLLRNTPNLESLTLTQSPLLSSSALSSTLVHASFASLLKSLDLSDCRGIGKAALKASLPRFPSLERLVVDGLPEVDDEVLRALAEVRERRRGGRGIVEISFRRCSDVTDEGICALVGEAVGIDEAEATEEAREEARISLPVGIVDEESEGRKAEENTTTTTATQNKEESTTIPTTRTRPTPTPTPTIMPNLINPNRIQKQHPFSPLRMVVMDECPRITSKGILRMASNCPDLEFFSARRCSRISDAALASLIAKGRLVPDRIDGFIRMIRGGSDCGQSGDGRSGIRTAGEVGVVGSEDPLKMSSVVIKRSPSFSFSPSISPSVSPSLSSLQSPSALPPLSPLSTPPPPPPPTEFQGLKSLCLNGIPEVGVEVFKSLIIYGRQSLEELDVGFCRNFPPPALGLLVEASPKLNKVNVYGCAQLTRDEVEAWKGRAAVIEGV